MSAWFASVWPSSSRRISAFPATALIAVLCGFFILCWPAASEEKKSAAPAVTCGTCHVGIVNSYAHAGMRHALEPAGANPALADHPSLSAQLGGYSYEVKTKGGQTTYSVSDGSNSITLPVRWFFGQHSQTWVLERDGHLYESLVSYFPREQTLAITPGDYRIVPHTLSEAMGRELSDSEARSCFECHATGATEHGKLALEKLRPGLECEHCHQGAQQHMADAEHDNFKTLPKPLRRMNAEETSNFCGQCHRTWETVVRNHWHGPAFVRFQPYRLENSKCFSGTDKRISCIACHDPHQPVSHDQAYYDSKCLACHSQTTASTALPHFKACSVGESGCVTCHMPKVELPGGHAQFTDHQIRIVRAGEPYPN